MKSLRVSSRRARRLNKPVRVVRRREAGEVGSKVKVKTRRKKGELRRLDRPYRKDRSRPRDTSKGKRQVNHPELEEVEAEVEVVLLLLLPLLLLLEAVNHDSLLLSHFVHIHDFIHFIYTFFLSNHPNHSASRLHSSPSQDIENLKVIRDTNDTKHFASIYSKPDCSVSEEIRSYN